MKGYFKENRPSLSRFFFFFFPFFQRLDKLEQFGKRPQASRMIVSHANNHLLTLSEFASDKANYHLKMSSKTLWAKSLHHDSQLYYCGYITTRVHTWTLTNAAQTHASVQPLNWLQDIIPTLGSDGGFVSLLHLDEIGFQPVRCCFCFIFWSLMLRSFEGICAALYKSIHDG